MKISKRHLVTCATLLQLIKVKIILEASQELGAEVRVVLREVAVVAEVVAGVLDADKVAETTITKRNCLPGVIQLKNGESSCMSRKNL